MRVSVTERGGEEREGRGDISVFPLVGEKVQSQDGVDFFLTEYFFWFHTTSTMCVASCTLFFTIVWVFFLCNFRDDW